MRIMMKSSNKGMAQIALKTGKTKLLDTFQRLHFGERVLEGATGEEPGNIGANRTFWAKSDVATLGYGHGQLQTNPLQLAAAMNAIATGSYARPRLIQAVELPGEGWRELPTSLREASFDPVAIGHLQEMLEMAVMNREGTGFRAQVPGYRIAGKTGTAKKVSRGDYIDKYVSSFLGYGPAEAPRYTILVMFDEPVNDRFGGQAAAPVFSELMGWLLRRDVRERQRTVPEPSAPEVDVHLARAY